MGEQGDQVSQFGDWGAPSPNTRAFFSSIINDDITSRSTLENNNEPSGLVNSEFQKPEMLSQQRMNSRVGLSERIAARAGFNAPRLNTEGVRPSGVSQNRDPRSPFLTIPPGLSPTTLLESPVFLSNQMAQPSPTTGQLPFFFGGMNTTNFSFSRELPEKNRENFYDNSNFSSFAFKPVPDLGPSTFLGPTNNNFPGFEVPKGTTSLSADTPPDDQQDEEGNEQPIGSEPLPGGPPADDGYNWRKYGQKQVKGSEYPRSYYKCTHPNCPVKKKVERSQEGHITEIIYKGAHIHPEPVASRRTGMVMVSDLQGDSVEVTSSASVGAENLQVQSGNRYESGDVVDGPSGFRDDDNEEDDRATHGSASLGYDGEEDEYESKRRKLEAYTAADVSGATRAIREPRVVVQTTSEVDILDDGYRWRKYGQKVVKGNPNPRSYYKCTHAGCTVRKHVERASHDLKSVITTYEGKHNHEVPAARNTSHHNSGNNNNGPAHPNPALPAHLQRPEQSLLHTAMARFNGPSPTMGSFGRPQFGFGMGQQGLANMAMAGLGPNRNNFVVGPPQMGQQQNYHNYNEMGFMLPKGEPKMEPFSDGSSIYPQMMSRLPLGP